MKYLLLTDLTGIVILRILSKIEAKISEKDLMSLVEASKEEIENPEIISETEMDSNREEEMRIVASEIEMDLNLEEISMRIIALKKEIDAHLNQRVEHLIEILVLEDSETTLKVKEEKEVIEALEEMMRNQEDSMETMILRQLSSLGENLAKIDLAEITSGMILLESLEIMTEVNLNQEDLKKTTRTAEASSEREEISGMKNSVNAEAVDSEMRNPEVTDSVMIDLEVIDLVRRDLDLTNLAAIGRDQILVNQNVGKKTKNLVRTNLRGQTNLKKTKLKTI